MVGDGPPPGTLTGSTPALTEGPASVDDEAGCVEMVAKAVVDPAVVDPAAVDPAVDPAGVGGALATPESVVTAAAEAWEPVPG